MNSSVQRQSPPSGGNRPHRCDRCGRSYTRRDHLARHHRSHSSHRAFACSICGKGFARSDLLLRHSSTIHATDHSAHTPSSRPRRPFSRRATKACRACAEAKVKCHDEKPCRRCLKRDIQCTPTSGNDCPGRLGLLADEPQGTAVVPPDGGSEALDWNVVSDGAWNVGFDSPYGPRRNDFLDGMVSDMAWLTGDTEHEGFGEENVMEDLILQSSPAIVPDIGTPFADLFQSNFGLSDWDELITKGRIRQASEAYKLSLWYSVPDQCLTREQYPGQIFASEDPEALMSDLPLPVPQRFSQLTRDNLFASLVIYAHEESLELLQTLCTTFPTPELLNTLVHLFFTRQDQKIDSWIHSASFAPGRLNMELTAMIVACSSLATSSPALHRLGTTLRRLLRPQIIAKIEKENYSSCKLELYQAFLLCLELDLWHDEEDCLHRAGRFSSVIASFVRQELADRYSEPVSSLLRTDNAMTIAEKWTTWIEAESFKRLVTRFCVYDNQLTMTLGVRASMTLSDYRPSLPQSRDLWLAKNEAKWNQLYRHQQNAHIPRIIDLFASMATMPLITESLDSGLAMKVNFHLIGGLITEYQLSIQSTKAIHEAPWQGQTGLDTSQDSRKRELERAITNYHHVFNTHIRASNIGPFVVSYLSMALNAPIRNIEVLAGKTGEPASRDMYHVMKDWPATSDAREAIWHAGQVLRLFKLLDRLTSFQIIIAYQAGLVLFAYSVLSCVTGCLPRRAALAAQAHNHSLPSELYLNDASPPSLRLEEFIRGGGDSFEPMLRSDFRGTRRVSVRLLDTKAAVDVISEIILNRACNCQGLSTRLVNGLVNLLKDLASAIQTSEKNSDPLFEDIELEGVARTGFY